ncbi:MAG TPA: PEGA domain-containing protein [Candidatus Nanoarchaeia archaeon]|nr:PEGA domain-containing protein [Candidatus Nanoarchaeia archaeon]
MTLTLRRIIYYSFCLLFLIITPLIILYASGYEIDWQHLFTPLAVQKTGMTIIYSTPSGANIFLNGQPVERFTDIFFQKLIPSASNAIRTPAHIKNLAPGSYDLSVQLPGYWPWQRRIDIFPGKITHVLDINLFKNTSPQLLASRQSQRLSLAPNNKEIFLPASGQLFDIKTQALDKISAAFSTSTDVSWSADSGRLAAGKALLNLKSPDKNLSLDKIIGPSISNLKWNGEMDKIYYQFKNSINLFNLADQSNETIIEENNILDYEVKGNYLYYAAQNGLNAQLKYFSLNDKKIVKTIDLPASSGYQLINPTAKLINLYDQKYETLYLIDPSVSAASPIIETIDSVKKTEWVNDKELVWANDYEIWVLDLDKNENKLITRWSLPIKSIIKTKAANYILFATEKNINVITWTATDEIQVTELASFDSIASPVFDDTEKNLYFTAKIGSDEGLYRLNIQ